MLILIAITLGIRNNVRMLCIAALIPSSAAALAAMLEETLQYAATSVPAGALLILVIDDLDYLTDELHDFLDGDPVAVCINSY